MLTAEVCACTVCNVVIWQHSAFALNGLDAAQVQRAWVPAPVNHSRACVLTPVSTAAQRCMTTSALPNLPHADAHG